MRIATWNVNGLRARQDQLLEFLNRYRPDVALLQEIKATREQLSSALLDVPDYCWGVNGLKGYSGVAILVRKDLCQNPVFERPAYDFDGRILETHVLGMDVLSVYVPNGNRDYPGKLRFLTDLRTDLARRVASGRTLLVGGDLNVARTERDVHPRERNPRKIGQLQEERDFIESILASGLHDVLREKHPDNDRLFSWWAPWRNMREKNIGWRLDYFLMSTDLATRTASCEVHPEIGTSDHGLVIAEITQPGVTAPATPEPSGSPR